MVEDNPINQQIALKTIKKLKFSVNAVWNGQEALDYLVKPPSADHPKPDIILMDVQMPVMDGYRAPYTIRHAEPFTKDLRIRNTPIVAMTASAIQGDREKCESAGMNDYLSKPVKSHVLEKMLVKWALDVLKKKQRKRSISSHRERPALKRQTSGPRTRQPLSQDTTSKDPSPQSSSDSVPTRPIALPARPARISSALSSNLAVSYDPSVDYSANETARRISQTPAVTVQNHFENEEKAMLLRDEQLIASGEDPKTQLSRGMTDESMHSDIPLEGDGKQKRPATTHRLTMENISRLDSVAGRAIRRQKEEDTSSMMATSGGTGSGTGG